MTSALMKFIVEFRLKPGLKRKAVEVFELREPNRNPGVTLQQAWIGNHSDIVYLLAESESESLVQKVAQGWSEYGTFEVHSVIDVEDF